MLEAVDLSDPQWMKVGKAFGRVVRIIGKEVKDVPLEEIIPEAILNWK